MLSFDSSPVVFFAIGYGLLWVVGILAADVLPHGWWQQRSIFILTALASLLYMRLPSLVYNYELNADESQMITQAITLTVDPVFWRSVDGTTGGPLNSYILLIPHWLGMPFSYISARLTGFVLLALTVWFSFLTTERLFGMRAAKLAVLPVLVFLSVTQHHDLVHYSGELLPIMLLSVIYWLVIRQLQAPRPSRRLLIAIGFLAGMVPFSKFQGGPPAAIASLYIAIVVLLWPDMSLGRRFRRVSWLLVAGLSFPLFVLLLSLWNGVFDDLITFYVFGNISYGAKPGLRWLTDLSIIDRLFDRIGEAYWSFGPVLLLAIVLPFVKRRTDSVLSWQTGGFLIIQLIVSVLTIMRAGSGYPHHLLFSLSPVVFMMGWIAACSQRALIGKPYPMLLRVILVSTILLSCSIPFAVKALYHDPTNPFVQNSRELQKSAVAKMILQYARPGEPLVVWGWRCTYYVETQMPQGVCENHTIRSAYVHPMQHLYMSRYLIDLRRSYPPVFVDAVGPKSLWLNDRRHYAHEAYPSLRSFVETHYRFVGEADSSRVYVRVDRYKPLRQLARN